MEHATRKPSSAPARLVDCRGLTCPLPILRTTRAMREIEAGGQLTILVTDVNAPLEFTAFCEATGHRMIEKTVEKNVFRITLEKT